MTCFRPLKGYINPEGQFKSSIRGQGWGIRTQVPCGYCLGCRIRKRNDWAIRCHHESKFHPVSTFITLTYDTEHLPMHSSLHKPHLTAFLNGTRQSNGSARTRFFASGEYGTKTHRPHYHAILFGYWPTDFKQARTGKPYAEGTSEKLSKLWNKGFVTCGAVNYATAAYVAKYCLERPTENLADRTFYYQRQDPIEDRQVDVEPEFNCQSPGLGKLWIQKYWTDVYPSDELVLLSGQQATVFKPPLYYDKWLRDNKPEIYAQVKLQRMQNTDPDSPENGETRLAIRELSKRANMKASQTKRNLK